MADEKILTKHPQGKSGKNILKPTYDLFEKTILEILKEQTLTHNELFATLNKKLTGKFSGNISWYGETMKLDMEARKLIERTNDKPQKYQLKRR